MIQLPRLFVIYMGFSLVLFSCKKEKDIRESFIYYEVDGIPYSFKSKTDLTFTFAGMYIQTTGKENPTDFLQLNSPQLSIAIKDHGTTIHPGTYSGKTYYSNGYTKEVSISYTYNNTAYQSAFTDPVTEAYISSISRDGVTGTFSGDVFKPANEDTLIITNGRFSIYTYK